MKLSIELHQENENRSNFKVIFLYSQASDNAYLIYNKLTCRHFNILPIFVHVTNYKS